MTRVALQLKLIVARARNGVIGKGGALPWHLPQDMAHFRQKTMGHPVIMGRKTWDSLPARFRPLPGRTNIVVTRQAAWHAEGAQRAGSLQQAIDLCGDQPCAWVIGGAQLYESAMALATEAHVTEIDADFEGDAYAAAFSAPWRERTRDAHVSADGLAFSFVTYQKTQRGD